MRGAITVGGVLLLERVGYQKVEGKESIMGARYIPQVCPYKAQMENCYCGNSCPRFSVEGEEPGAFTLSICGEVVMLEDLKYVKAGDEA
jgi:hypothetical protein